VSPAHAVTNGFAMIAEILGAPSGAARIAASSNKACHWIRGKLAALMRSGCHLVPVGRGPA
jgi:hypothetical protein